MLVLYKMKLFEKDKKKNCIEKIKWTNWLTVDHVRWVDDSRQALAAHIFVVLCNCQLLSFVQFGCLPIGPILNVSPLICALRSICALRRIECIEKCQYCMMPIPQLNDKIQIQQIKWFIGVRGHNIEKREKETKKIIFTSKTNELYNVYFGCSYF